MAGLLAACGESGPTTELKQEVVANYANGVHHLYSQSLGSAQAMDRAIDQFLQEPTAAHLEAAKRLWLIARDDYGPTEAFRFYDGPIDHPDTGPEGLINAWPLADPDDADGDGISGRPNMVWDIRRSEVVLGRFGWKANEPTVEQQAAAAFLGDIGITSTLFPEENCPAAQDACAAAPNGGTPEIPDERLAQVEFYVQTLAVPAMRNVDDPRVRRGAELFVQTGCAACHRPRHVTGDDHPVEPLRNQTIFPFTDLLLHDMGEGLADGRPDGLATGREWRTPPLWGIGLVEVVNRHTMFLHDGRARSLEEAILWHGGEGQAARDQFMALTRDERDALLQFLRSL